MDYPYAYQSQRLTMAELEAKVTWRNCHPEFRRRLKALLLASNGHLGVGTAWRSPAAQDAERARRLATGTGAQMAPSGRSYHCNGMATDLVGDLDWAAAHCGAFGLLKATWGGEAWHFQPSEIPHARPLNQNPALRTWSLPGGVPTPVPHPQAPVSFPPFDPAHAKFSLWPFATNKPTVRLGSIHESVKYLQSVLRWKANQQEIRDFDGRFGPVTLRAVRNVQAISGLPVTGIVNAATWAVIDRLAGT